MVANPAVPNNSFLPILNRCDTSRVMMPTIRFSRSAPVTPDWQVGLPIPAIRSIQRNVRTSRPSCKGTASRIAAEMLRQLEYHVESTIPNPQSHTAASSVGTELISLEETVAARTPVPLGTISCVKGWLISISTGYNQPCDPAVAGDQIRWPPIPASTEKGSRNFSDAANHSQYRQLAWSFGWSCKRAGTEPTAIAR